MPVPADFLIVIATLVTGLSLASVVAGWTVRRWPVTALLMLTFGLCLFIYLHVEVTDGLSWTDVPDAFISVAARFLN